MVGLRFVALQPHVYADARAGERSLVSPDGEPRQAVPQSARVGNDWLDRGGSVDHVYSVEVFCRRREELAAAEDGGNRFACDGDLLIHPAKHAASKRRKGNNLW